VDDYVATVYANPGYIDTLSTSTPISSHVPVDFEVRGCPVNPHQLLEVLTAYLAGRAPRIPSYTVCQECKAGANVCVLVAGATPCLGPVTRAGCGAVCPNVGRACFGCFGPSATANTTSLAGRLFADGASPAHVVRLFRSFTAGAPEFAKESAAHDA
jgi:coenzyme F420-reducing hydrogenase gamma subunit